MDVRCDRDDLRRPHDRDGQLMGFHVNENGDIIVTGSESVELARRVAIKHALRLEIKTGMTRRGRSTLQLAREVACEEFTTKKQALAWFEEHYPSPKDKVLYAEDDS